MGHVDLYCVGQPKGCLLMLSKVNKDRGMHPTTEIPRYIIIRILAGWKGFLNVRMRSKHRQVFRASVRRLKYWKKKSLV